MLNDFMQQPLVDFYSELINVAFPEDAVDFIEPPPEALKLGRQKAIPLNRICHPKVKTDVFFEVIKQVAAIIKKHQPDLAADMAKIETALPVEPERKSDFISRAFIPGNNLSSYLKLDISPGAFEFLLNYTVKPFMRQYGKLVTSVYDLEQWLQGYCPVCGSKPNMALLEKQAGKRYLSCGLCETRWRYHRLGCPYCSNGESQFFTIEDMKKHRVYFCEKCNGYIKTVDEKYCGGREINLFWEDINTIYLDIAAMQEGYFNHKVDLPLKDTEK